MITDRQIQAFHRDGAVMIKGAMTDWVDVMRAGVARNMEHPSKYASENDVPEGQGRFFDDYCNWRRIPEYELIVRQSPAAEIAARSMQSTTAQFFHDHVLVKESDTIKPTPWHQDSPYYFVEGSQTVSMWLPLDPVKDATLRLLAGSHQWEKMVRPVSWSDDSDFYDSDEDWSSVPDPDSDHTNSRILEWAMEPGDLVLFDYRTVHGARGNLNASRRRALSLRWLGDDARYVERPGRTSPPFPDHEMVSGQRLREDWFPVVWTR